MRGGGGGGCDMGDVLLKSLLANASWPYDGSLAIILSNRRRLVLVAIVGPYILYSPLYAGTAKYT